MRVFNHLGPFAENRLARTAFIAGLICLAWLISRRFDQFTYQASIRVDHSDTIAMQVMELKDHHNFEGAAFEDIRETLIHHSIRKTGIRLTVHDLSSPKPFRSTPEGYLSGDLTRLRRQLNLFLGTHDTHILEEAYPDQLIRDFGYDPASLKENLSFVPSRDHNGFMVSFTSENPLLSAFVVNDLCRELIKTDQKFFSEQKRSNLGTVLHQLHIIEENWTDDFSEERFVMETEGKRYWLHDNYPRLKSFVSTKSIRTNGRLRQIHETEQIQGDLLRERLTLLREARHLVKYLQHLEKEYPRDGYESVSRTINLKISQLAMLNGQIDSLDQVLEKSHLTIRHLYSRPPLILVRNEESVNVVEDFRQLMEDANQMAFYAHNYGNRIRRELNSDQASRTPDLMRFFWIMILIVAVFHFSGLFMDNYRTLWENKN